MSVYTRWYKEGTISVTSGSTAVTGSNTYWTTAGLNPGDIVKIGGVDYELLSVEDNTHITLATNFKGNTASGLTYSIVRNFTATSSAKVAAMAAGLMGDVERYISTDMQKINGKSAYEVAVANGYTGTVTQWLESLKGAGEISALQTRCANIEAVNTSQAGSISALDTRSKSLISQNANAHRWIYRGRSLGSTFTTAQSNAIQNGTFDDLFIGDYWTFGGHRYVIIDFNYFKYISYPWEDASSGKNHAVIMCVEDAERCQFKAEGNLAGGYMDSDIRKNMVPEYTQKVAGYFGAEHLFYHVDYLCNAVNSSGVMSGWTKVTDSCVELPSWRFLFHHPANIVGVPTTTCLNWHVKGMFAYFQMRQNTATEYLYRKDAGCWLRECDLTRAGYAMLAYDPNLNATTNIATNIFYFTIC